jgi:hypothetical protein
VIERRNEVKFGEEVSARRDPGKRKSKTRNDL